jgi:hypothetical protein
VAPERPPRGFASSLGLFLIAVLALHAWSSRSRFLYEADSLGFAFGMHEFAVQKDQPHAPGYPLWILCARLVDRLALDANTSLTALAFAFAVASALLFFDLARRRASDAGAVVLTTLFVASPAFLFNACTPTTYAVDLFGSTALGALAARAWRGSFRHALIGAALAGVLTGFRQSGVVLMLPLLVVATALASGSLRRFAYAGLAGAATSLAWYLPTAMLHGGVREFQRITARRILAFLGDTSVFFGAPAQVHWEMATCNAIWLGLLAAPCALLWLLARVTALPLGRQSTNAPRPFSDWRFGSLWLVPNLLYVFLIHAPKPGYLCLTLPPLVLFLGGAATDLLERSARWLDGGARAAWLFKPLAPVLLSFAIWQLPWSESPDARPIDASGASYRLSLQAIRDSDDAIAAVLGLLQRSDPSEELIVADDPRFGGLVQRKIAFYLPRHSVLFVYPDQPGFHEQKGFETRPFGPVPKSVRRVWWVGPMGDTDPHVGALGPVTHLAYRGSWVSAWVSEVEDTPLAVRIGRGRASGDFRRELAPHLGPGFFPLEGSGESRSVWASGPSASVHIPQAAAGPVTVTLSAHAARPAQRLVILANGKSVATADTPQSSAPIAVTFVANAGNNQLDLAFDSWNGVPSLFAPEDSRPLGMMIRQLSKPGMAGTSWCPSVRWRRRFRCCTPARSWTWARKSVQAWSRAAGRATRTAAFARPSPKKRNCVFA